MCTFICSRLTMVNSTVLHSKSQPFINITLYISSNVWLSFLSFSDITADQINWLKSTNQLIYVYIRQSQVSSTGFKGNNWQISYQNLIISKNARLSSLYFDFWRNAFSMQNCWLEIMINKYSKFWGVLRLWGSLEACWTIKQMNSIA